MIASGAKRAKHKNPKSSLIDLETLPQGDRGEGYAVHAERLNEKTPKNGEATVRSSV